jgi:hypothetical protein
MPLSITNGIGFSDINTDLGFNSNNQIDLNNSLVRKLLNNAVSDVSMQVANGRSLTTAIGYMISSNPTTGTNYDSTIHDCVIDTTTNIMYMLIVTYNNSTARSKLYVVALDSATNNVVWSRNWNAIDFSVMTPTNYQRHKLFLSGSYLYVSSYGIPNDTTGNQAQNLISKLNISDGTPVWSQGLVDSSSYIGDVPIHGLKVDPSGNNIYIAGEYKKNLTKTGETNQMIAYVGSLYSSNGNIRWIHKFGAASNTGTTHVPWSRFITVAVDSSNVYVGGTTSALTITAGAAPSYYYGLLNKYDSDGNLQWTKTFRDSSSLSVATSYSVTSTCTDTSGNLYVVHTHGTGAAANAAMIVTSWNAAGTSRWTSPEYVVDVASPAYSYNWSDYSNNGMQIGPDGNLWIPGNGRPSTSSYDSGVVVSLNSSTGALINARRFANNETSGDQEYNEGNCIPLAFDKYGYMLVPSTAWNNIAGRGYAALIFRANTATPTTLVGPDKSNVTIKLTATSALQYYAYANLKLNTVTSTLTTTTNSTDVALPDPTFLTLRDPTIGSGGYNWANTGSTLTGYVSRSV